MRTGGGSGRRSSRSNTERSATAFRAGAGCGMRVPRYASANACSMTDRASARPSRRLMAEMHFIRLIAVVLALAGTAALAQRPDPTTFGNRIELGDVEQARAWLRAGLHPDTLADRIGTGLMIAAWRGDLAMMELFLSRGADVDKTNAVGETALMHAAWQGQKQAVDLLLARGAQVNSGNGRWSALHYAAFAGHDDIAAMLLGRGADINARAPNGSSPLMMAVYEGHEQMARQLLARGADTAVKNDRGEGALEWAVKFRHTNIARLVGSSRD